MSSKDKEKSRLHPGFKYGRSRIFEETLVPESVEKRARFSRIDHFLIFALLALGVLVRLYQLPLPAAVVFDETHFGGFAHDYFRGSFFLDVHPPMAKLVFYWIACLMGWDGEFDFAHIGDEFDANVPFVTMRLFLGLCGVATVVLTYAALRYSLCRPISSFFGAFLVVIENSMVTQSRLIMLDSTLLMGVAFTVFAFKRFQLLASFTKTWYKFLITTGIGLGLTISTKWTGFFTFAWLGILTAIQLWKILGDLEVSDWKWFKHVYVRIVGLVLVPLTIYLGFFALHFISLPFNGTGSGAVSPSFKASFQDSDALVNQPVAVSFGATITLKHNNLEGYLHSHNFNYLTGSKEQQVSLYEFTPDENNEWIIEGAKNKEEGYLQENFKQIKSGDIVRLLHKATGKYLHVNDLRPPISEHDYSNEVSCAGDRNSLEEVNYQFRLRILSKKPHSNLSLPMIKLRATESIFQLVHKGTHCVLISHEEKLPAWGFNQREVLCVEEPTIPNSLWYIESNSHPVQDSNFADFERVHFKELSFLEKLWEYHTAMWRLNKSLTEKHNYASTPESWPFLTRGVRYISHRTDPTIIDQQPWGSNIYLLGNVAIYYIGFLLITLNIGKNLIYAFKILNPFEQTYHDLVVSNFHRTSFEFFLGWFCHYFPSFLMDRQLFLHHYLTPLYFSILMMAIYVDYQISRRKYFGYLLMVAISAAAGICFVKFSPLIYGLSWTQKQCHNAKWLPSWDFDCSVYSP